MRLDDNLFMRIVRGLNPSTLLDDPQLVSRCSSHADMQQNLWLLYSLCVGINAQSILEIGTNDGTSTLAFLKAAHETGGRVLSIDISDVPHARAILDKLEIADRWEFRQGDSRDVLRSLWEEGRHFDAILVDGDHTHAGARKDVDWSALLLRDNGLLFFHDSFMFRDGDVPGCGYAVRELLDGDEWQGIVLPFNCHMTVFQKKRVVIDQMDREIALHPFGYPLSSRGVP